MTSRAKHLVLLRRACQVLSVALLVTIIWNTRYPLSGFINPAFYFYLDPFAMVITSIAERVLLTGLVSAAIVLALTFVIGRGFCGWLCPLGALLDLVSWARTGARRLFGKKEREPEPSPLRYKKYAILLAVFVFALFGVQVAWVLDPITIFVRAFSFNIHPFVNGVLDAGLVRALEATGYPEWLETFYDWLREWFLAVSTPQFSHAGAILGVLVAILVLSLVRKRFWCRYLCPLGATLALPARFSPFVRTAELCTKNCGICRNACRMNAIREDNSYIREECILCLDCMAECPGDKTTFSFRRLGSGSEPRAGGQGTHRAGRDSYRLSADAGVIQGVRAASSPVTPPFLGKMPVLTRSQFITAAMGAIVIASGPLSAATVRKKGRPGTASGLRPPGALPEQELVQRCIRCGNCMKVCPTNLLQPSSFAEGPVGAWSPVLDTRRGYCEYGCNLCGQVCPTDAIGKLTLEQKQKFVIGTAVFDKKICLPYAKGENCIVCEEHCPVPDKAIRIKEALVNGKIVKQPYVVKDLCIGCAICELKCPTAPDKGVVVMKSRDAAKARSAPVIKPVSR
jgi:MauM/NapG family ferredoxin protein